MSDQEINSKIAQLCPDVIVRPTGQAGWNYRSGIAGRILPCINGNVFTDLNAMHEVENGFSAVEKFDYFEALQDVMEEIVVQNIIHATAQQRAEAFLKVKGEWKE